MNLGTADVVRANARNLPLPDNSVDLVVTSPPYFALRSYQDAGVHYQGQIGDEPTPDEFVSSLLEVTAECVRVLKPSGSLWVNLGDKYSGAQQQSSGRQSTMTSAEYWARTNPKTTGVKAKSLYGIPWRYALRCIDDLGLILRAEVIWSKPNGLPESVTDRVRRSHEQWFHFTLDPRYFSAVDEIREQYAPETTARYTYGFKPASAVAAGQSANGPTRADGGGPGSTNPLGKLPGSVWTVPTEPLRVPDHLGVDHFAAFPTEWPKRIIQGWSPAGVCVECGEGRRPVVERPSPVGNVGLSIRDDEATGAKTFGATSQMRLSGGPRQRWKEANPDTLIGYACACPEPTWETSPHSGVCATCDMPSDWADGCSAGCEVPTLPPTTPAVVLDPFGGTGTTAMVAKALGRHGISVDMSADYCRLAEWRTNDRDQLAKVLGVAKAEQQPDDQLSIFDLGEPA